MHPLRGLLVYLGAVLIAGPMLAPGLYKLTAWAGTVVPACAELAQEPFRRFVHRSLLGVALVGMWPLIRVLGFRSWREVGWVKPSGQGRNLLVGLGLGLGSLVGVAALGLVCSVRRLEPSLAWEKLAGAAASAGVVAVLEETLFRGVVFGALRRAHNWVVAAGFSSVVYALVHCFAKPPAPQEVTWLSGFTTLAHMLQGFVQVETLLPEVVVLTLAGLVLAVAFERTGTLYAPVGLHAGWILSIRLYSSLTAPVPGTADWFWGVAGLTDGWATGLVLAGLLVIVARLGRGRSGSAVWGANAPQQRLGRAWAAGPVRNAGASGVRTEGSFGRCRTSVGDRESG